MRTSIADMQDVPTERLSTLSDEYAKRIKAKQPTKPPRFEVGQNVFSSIHGCNMPIVRVEWDDSNFRILPQWVVSIPGYTCAEMGGGLRESNDDAPTKRYQKINNCWHETMIEPSINSGG